MLLDCCKHVTLCLSSIRPGPCFCRGLEEIVKLHLYSVKTCKTRKTC